MSESLLEMLSAREQLLLDVSHELRSPMTRMKAALEFILKIHPVKFTHRCAGNGADGNGDFRNCPAEK